MTRLSNFRSQLTGLRRRRRHTRWTTGYSALVTALLAALALIMFLDWFLAMSFIQRAMLLAAGLALMTWVFRRYTRPWLGQRENEIDLALVLEQQQQIDSDLVAALQFESPAAPLWGSAELEQAVIQHAVELGGRVSLENAVPRRELSRRLTAMLAMATVWVALLAIAPQHVAVFFHRIAFGSRHYPGGTVITDVTVNGCQVDPARPWLYPIKVPAGSSVQFGASYAGRAPRRGEVCLTTRPTDAPTLVKLTRAAASGNEYRGELPRLFESAEYRIFLGDAWTERASLAVVALPVADLALAVEPPAYVLESIPAGKSAPGLRHISVMEGSRVVVRLIAEKRLREAWITMAGGKYSLRRENSGAESLPDRWILDADAPLSAVIEPLQYAVQVTDVDGLHLEQPIQGTIRIQPDQRPRVAAAAFTPVVLPNAAPVVHWRAVDDFGLARVSLLRQVTRADGNSHEDEIELYQRPSQDKPRKDMEADYELNLDPLKLHKDDVVRLMFRATDYRGPREGQQGQGEPLVFRVSDLPGVLTMVTEPDRKSAEQLKAMVDRQLGIGGAP